MICQHCKKLPASGLWEVKTKPRVISITEVDGEESFQTTRSKTHILYLCASCGFNAPSKRTFNVFDYNGKEEQSFPLAYYSVNFLRSLTPEEFYKPPKEQPERVCNCGHTLSAHPDPDETDRLPCKVSYCPCNGFDDGPNERLSL